MVCILFNYRNKTQTNIHTSLFCDLILWIIRPASLVLMIVRMAMYDGGSGSGYTLLFLTDYGFIFTLIYFTLVTIHFIANKLVKQSKVIMFIGELINVIFESVFAIEFVLTLLFWILLSEGQENLFAFNNLGLHLFPLLYLSIDFIFNTYAFPMRHIIITFIFALIYISINQVYSCTHNKPVYPVYECGNWWIPLVALTIITIVHLIGHTIWKFCRLKILNKRKINKNENENENEQSLISN